MMTCEIDTSGLMRAQAIFNDYSRHTPAQALNRTVLFILRDAQKATPFATMSRIDTDMGATTTPRVSAKTGKIVSRKTRNANVVKVSQESVVTSLVLARMVQGSKYNKMTDHRYFIDRSTFSAGRGTKGFWKKVEQVAIRMVKARHSSTHFFQSTWGVIIKKLLPHVPAGYRGGSSVEFGGKSDTGLGDATAAFGGGLTCVAIIENHVGTSGAWPNTDARRNAYLQGKMAGILQSAIDREYESKMEEAAKRGWLDRASALRACGFEVAA